MALRLGVCKNKPTCSKARVQEPISMKWSKGFCPECGKKLKPKYSSYIPKKPVFLISVIVGGGVLIGWNYLTPFFSQRSSGDDEPQPEEPQSPFIHVSYDAQPNEQALPSHVEENVDVNMPKCLLSSSSEMRKRLPMAQVPKMQREKIPGYLHAWMKAIANSTIDESPFFIMRREVTVGEFQSYVDTLNSTDKEKLGETWLQEDKDYPVASVPWWAAQGYADWLSKNTDCSFTLPTYNQWVAAAIHYADPKKAVIRDTFERKHRVHDEKPNEVVDLLGNLREWSIDNCRKGGHYLLGEDYKTWQVNIAGKPFCERSTLDTVGFRVVLQ